MFTCNPDLLSGNVQIPWWHCGVSFVLIVLQVHSWHSYSSNSFQPDLYRAPFERNILVMLPILDDVAQSQNILIYRRYDFFIAKHMGNPVADPRFLVLLMLFFVIIFQIQSQSFFFFFFYQEQGGFQAPEPQPSFIHHWKLFSNDLCQPRNF